MEFKHLTAYAAVVRRNSFSKAAEELLDCAPWTIRIGDCNRASTITNAVYQGYHAALDL